MAKFFALLVLGIFLIGLVCASDIAYVVKGGADSVIIDAIDETGYSYDVIDDSELAGMDWEDYLMLVVWDERFTVPAEIPVGSVKSLVGNTWHVDDWAIADYAGSQTSSNYQKGRILIDNLITNGLASPVQLYDSKSIVLHYLPPPYRRAPGLQNVLATDNSHEYPVVGIINKGGGLYGGGVAGEKIVFIGATETDYWTDETGQMFKNSILWLIGEDADEDGWYTGDDCDDTDATVNPGSSDPAKNCVNDAPVVEVIEDISVVEGGLVVVEINAIDFEDDDLVYSIDGFVQDSWDETKFTWQTDLNDDGDYDFTAVVSDGEFDISVDFEVSVGNLNQAPVCSEVPDVVWDEDGTAELNLGDYCSDADGDAINYYVEDTSEDEYITLGMNNGLVEFSVVDDWSGDDWIIFGVDDGNSNSTTNRIELIVEPVNDAPTYAEIPDLEINEDEDAEEYLDLNNYFSDIDSELSYSVSGNSHVVINIDDGLVSFYPEADWFGEESIVFSAYDGEFDVDSDVVVLRVLDMNEPPEFDALVCEVSLLEDEQYTCVVSATDFEGDDFVFSVADEDEMSCDFEGDVLTYKSDRDYYGDGSCVLRVSDVEGYSDLDFEVVIANVNDAPEIYDYSPKGYVKILENTSKEFSISVRDVDSSFVVEWFLDGVSVGSGLSYLFNQPEGAYEVKAVASDGSLEDDKIWNVVVGDISEFTCEEVGGFEFSEREVCIGGEVLGVKDTARCCSVEPEPAFSDVDRCVVRDERVVVEIKEPDDGDDFKIGEMIEFKIKIENNLNEDLDFDIEAYLYDISEDKSLEDIDDSMDIDKGKRETVNFEFEVPGDFDGESGHALFVKVIDEDEIFCNEAYVRVDFERKSHEVVINNIKLGESMYAGYANLNVELENKGEDDEDVLLVIEGDDGFNYEEEFEIDNYDGDSLIKKDFLVKVKNGKQDFKVVVFYDDRDESVSKTERLEWIESADVDLSGLEVLDLNGGGVELVGLGAINGIEDGSESGGKSSGLLILVLFFVFVVLMIVASLFYFDVF